MKPESIWQLMLVLVGAMASALGGYWVGNRPEEVGYIEYRIDSENTFKKFLGAPDELKISYRGVEYPDLSRVAVNVANRTKKNIEGIKIYVTTKDKEKSALISDFAVPEGFSREAVKVLPEANGVHSFEISYMNRSDYFWNGFGFYLYFPGGKAPEVDVSVVAKGVVAKRYDGSDDGIVSVVARSLMRLWWVLVIYLLLYLIYQRYISVSERMQRIKTATIIHSLMPDCWSEEQKQEKTASSLIEVITPPNFLDVVKKFFAK